MRKCPACNNKALSLKNIFSMRYKCNSCGAVCTTSTRHKALDNILINFLPVLGVILAVVFKSSLVLLVAAIIVPLLITYWYQKQATLYVLKPGG